MKKYRILYEGSVLADGLGVGSRRSGIYVVVYNIFRQLLRRDDLELLIYCEPAKRKDVAEFVHRQLQQEGLDRKVQIVTDDCRHLGARGADLLSDVDAVLSPVYPHLPEVIASGIRRYTILYDAIPYIFPDLFPDTKCGCSWNLNLLGTLTHEDVCFAISEQTKKDFLYFSELYRRYKNNLLEMFRARKDVNPFTKCVITALEEREAAGQLPKPTYLPFDTALCQENIEVIPLAASENFYVCEDRDRISDIRAKYRIPKDCQYVISLCTLERRKNLLYAIRSFLDFVEHDSVKNMVFVLGGGSWANHFEELAEGLKDKPGWQEKVLRIGYVDDKDLAALFSGAFCMAYPSLYEGFGLPPLEAMQCGCPVIASDNSSLPEVVADAGILVNIDDPTALSKAFEKLYRHPEMRRKFIQRGQARAKHFSWEKAGDVIHDRMIRDLKTRRGKTYFDLTSCIDYIGRNPLGIVRVEMKFAQYALSHKSPQDFCFCYYDRPSGQIKNISFGDAQRVLDQIGRSAGDSPPSDLPDGGVATASDATQTVRGLLKRIRNRLRKRFSGNLRMLNFLQRCEENVKRVLGNEVSPPAPQPVRDAKDREDLNVDWTELDTFVTVGLIWDYLPVGTLYDLKKKRGFKIVGMIYDIVPYRVPEFCLGVPPTFFSCIVDLIWCADEILTISQLTKSDVEAFIDKYQLPKPKLIDICYLGMDVGSLKEGYVPDPSELDVSRLRPGKFVLQVGTMEPRKNHALTLTTWRMLCKENFPELMPIVVVGAQAWGVGDILEMARRDRNLTPKYFVHSNRVSDQSLLWLYENCFMTVYPSFYEDWGLPISESLSYGRFCLTGDNGALREAGGEFVESLSPYDTLGWARRLKELMQHPEIVAEKVKRIKESYRSLSWEESARKFYEQVDRVREGLK